MCKPENLVTGPEWGKGAEAAFNPRALDKSLLENTRNISSVDKRPRARYSLTDYSGTT